MAKYFPDGKGSNLVNTESNDEHFEKTEIPPELSEAQVVKLTEDVDYIDKGFTKNMRGIKSNCLILSLIF